jgi:hypothetical protein
MSVETLFPPVPRLRESRPAGPMESFLAVNGQHKTFQPWTVPI